MKVAPVCIGIAQQDDWLTVVTRQAGKIIGEIRFPAHASGQQALHTYLARWQAPLRLALLASGTGLSLALALGNHPGREVFLVRADSFSASGAQPLAHYAERSL